MTGPRDIDALDVFKGERLAGTLARTERGARFAYSAAYLAAGGDPRRAAIAFALPLRAQPYDVAGVNLHPFFAGLLPEGLRLRALVRNVKTSEDDLFTLLAAVGRDTVGDVSAAPAGETPCERSPGIDPKSLGEVRFRELLARSLETDATGFAEAAVAGVQPKLSAAMISFPVRTHGRRRSCLLKLAPQDHPRLVENEAFFMRLARTVGLPTARAELVHDVDGEAALLVERFDRVARADTDPERLHQEDACQLLGRYPADKYRLQLADVAAALEVCSAPQVARLRLLELQAFSYAIAGGDLHARNVSVLVHDGLVTLTPAYDLVSTLPYGDRRMALAMEGRDDHLNAAHFMAFGERVGVRAAATRRMLTRLVRRIGPAVDRLPEIGLSAKATRHLAKTMTERLAELTPG